MIQNIVLNATHAMPEGGMIRISGENHITAGSTFLPDAGGRYVKIAIEDSGIGMPVNAVEKIFDPYFSTKQEGSGLGLAITQSIIQKHNGHITVESSPGSGSTFTIYLPASEKCRTQSRRSLIDVAPPAPVKVLIMDDDAMVRDIAQQMLSHLGPEVVLAPDGEETVTCYQQAIDTTKPFDLVIMDLTIPGGMGGKEAIQEILKFDQDARAIVSSGYSNDPVMADFKKYGFCAAIAKPFQLQDLSRVISRIIA